MIEYGGDILDERLKLSLTNDIGNLFNVQRHAGKPADAKEIIRSVDKRLFTFRAKKMRLLRGRANRARDAKDVRNAALLYEASLNYDPYNAAILIQCGHMHKEAGNLINAELHYLRARTLVPDDADLNLQLGHFYKVAGRPHEARVAYQRAADLLPNWTEPKVELEALRPLLRETMVAYGLINAPNAPQAAPPQSQNGALPRSNPLMQDALPGVLLTVEQVVGSGLFDGSWYLSKYSDVAAAGLDPLAHFIGSGMAEGRAPGPGFHPASYRESYPEIDESGLDPFSHYMLVGRIKGLKPFGIGRYFNWVSKFDTLSSQDRAEIGQHISDDGMLAPLVIMIVDAVNADGLLKAIQGLRSQILVPTEVILCLGPDCPIRARQSAWSLVGSDPLFRIIEAANLGSIEAHKDKLSHLRRAEAPVVLLDTSAELREHALYMLVHACGPETRLVYSDEDHLDADGLRCNPLFKPDASPELLHHSNYLGACILLNGASANVGRLVDEIIAGQATVASAARAIFFSVEPHALVHVPFVLFHARAPQAPPQFMQQSAPNDATLPTVTVIVPTRDKIELLRACVESLWEETSYPADKLEVIVVDNGSTQWEALDYLEAAASEGKVRIITDARPFNYARLNNLAARSSTSDLLVLLNNDTEIQDSAWLRRLAEYATQPDIGVVGPKLLYADGTIQHGGVVLNIGGVAAHAHLGLGYDECGAMGLAQMTHEVAAVTGACLAIRRQVFEEVGGLDESLPVAFNDVLLCLACLTHGYRNIYLPHTWLRHYESKTRGIDDTPSKRDIYLKEAYYARRRFPALFKRDPYYNPNLDLSLEDFYKPAFPPRCVYPWREHARVKQPRRILILSKNFDDTDDIGVWASVQARYFMYSGYDVLVGSPDPQPKAYLDGVSYVKLTDSKAAAVCATKLQVDVVVVHSPPYFSTASLLGNRPLTVLFYSNAWLGGPNNVDRKVAMSERDLSSLSFDLIVTPSKVLAEQLDRDDVVICPPGGDLLGAWNLALLPRRDQVRSERGWNGRIVVLVKLNSLDAATGTAVLEKLESLSVHFDHSQVIFAVMGKDLPAQIGQLVFLGPRPVGSSLINLYVAADLYLDTAPPNSGSLELAEASNFGLEIIRMDHGLTQPPDGAGSDNAILKMARQMTERMRPLPRDRQASGPTWAASFSILDSAITIALGSPAARAAVPPVGLLSDRSLISWSGLFDADYYCKLYPDIVPSGQDPMTHFCDYGGREARQPSELFWSDWYARSYPEAKRLGGNLLAHYLRQHDGVYDPNPFFSNTAYVAGWADRSQNPDTAALPPFLHYLWHGAPQGRSPGPNFDPQFYRETYLDVPAGMDPLVHFLRFGVREGRMALRPTLSKMDVYDLHDIARVTDRPREELSWRSVKAASVCDRRTAIRFCIDLLAASPSLRACHPRALSGGASGSFFKWLVGDGAVELGLSETSTTHLRALFEEDFAAPLVQTYLTRADLRTAHPFALLPVGIGGFVKWLITSGIQEIETSIEQIRWFAITRAEDPGAEIVRTYRFTPAMQRQFPDGITIFARKAFATWLRQLFSEDEAWTDPASWPLTLTVTEQIRLAYAASNFWQHIHPAPYASPAAGMAFIDWLKSPSAKLDLDASNWLSGLNSRDILADLIVEGVNMIGHFCYPSGLRTSTVSLLKGYHSVGHHSACRDVWVETIEAEPRHGDYGGLEVYDTTIIHTQPEPFFNEAYSRSGLAPRTPRTYRIGYWYWELDTVPQSWLGQASQLDEIWTATRFVGDALRGRFKLPVHEIMPGFELPSFIPLSRDYFGLPKTQYLFLFTFHMMSIMERKNPLGLIAAFRRAFAGDASVGLVLKTSYGDKHQNLMKEMRGAAQGSNIIIIDAIYTQSEVIALMQTCDAYVSLHRSEGYGLTMLEAMLLGKPVIATGYSGNLDFMTPETGLLVDYDLVTLERAVGPYEIGTQWAEPSIRHAAECMQKVRADLDWSRAMGQRAKVDLETRLSYKLAGQRMAARLAEINKARISQRE